MSVNKFIGIGNLGRDPEMRFMPNGNAVCNFSIAISEKYKDKNSGEWKELTEWVNIVMFGKLAEIAGEYLAKGSKVYVEGKLKTEKYTDKNGVEKTATKVVGEKMDMLSPKGEAKPVQSRPEHPPLPDKGGFDDMDDQIPF
jgi:single-strand DNA-binding protein